MENDNPHSKGQVEGVDKGDIIAQTQSLYPDLCSGYLNHMLLGKFSTLILFVTEPYSFSVAVLLRPRLLHPRPTADTVSPLLPTWRYSILIASTLAGCGCGSGGLLASRYQKSNDQADQ